MGVPQQTAYSDRFFDWMDRVAERSSAVVCPLLLESLPIRSVLDVGCGRGGWLSTWRRLGVDDVMGVDGCDVAPERLLVPPGSFRAHDLTSDFDLGRKFDLVQSLEVAEHLDERCAEAFVRCLARHGDLVLFSAAVPGQTGVHHVNEQPLGYWKVRFERLGFVAVDALRPRVEGIRAVAVFYRANTLLYVRADQLRRLPRSLAEHVLPEGTSPPDYSPWGFRMYKLACRHLLPRARAPSRRD